MRPNVQLHCGYAGASHRLMSVRQGGPEGEWEGEGEGEGGGGGDKQNNYKWESYNAKNFRSKFDGEISYFFLSLNKSFYVRSHLQWP